MTRQGVTVDPSRAVVTVDGRPVRTQKLVYLAFHKPLRVLCTSHDPQGRATIHDFLPDLGVRLYSAGRLDEDSEGLLLVTNDGALVHRMLHPRHHEPKVYHAWLDVPLEPEQIRQLKEGIRLTEGMAHMDAVRLLGNDRGAHVYEIVLREGRKRQIRRMIGSTGRHILRLMRVGFGPLRLAGLATGAWRHLTDGEVRHLRAGLDEAPVAAPAEPLRAPAALPRYAAGGRGGRRL